MGESAFCRPFRANTRVAENSPGLTPWATDYRPSGAVNSYATASAKRTVPFSSNENWDSPPPITAHDPAINQIIFQVAHIARRFHAAGYNHRDLYCCHFLIREPAAGRFDIRLIDLQRVQRRRWFRWRWIVKDLAQLAYSRSAASRSAASEQIALAAALPWGAEAAAGDRRLVRAVMRKVAAMQRRLGASP